jgi:uncharacterized membrane protein (DUF2068 family)
MNKKSGLRLIALYKLVHGSLLIGVSLGIFRLVHANLDELAREFLIKTRLDANNHHIQYLLEHFVNLSPKTIESFGIAALCSSALTLTEGLGLWFGKRWAEYLVILSTSLFLPWEIRHLIHHPTLLKLVIFVFNLLIVAYLVVVILKKEKPPRSNQ